MNVRSNLLLSRRQMLFSLASLGASTLLKPSSLFALDSDKPNLRFAVIGDWGSGDKEETELAKKMFELHQQKPFEFILTVGDNIYPNGNAKYFGSKFEKPFEDLIKAKVPFYATLGNHDVEEGRAAQINYPLFNMGGENYYKLSKANGLVDFFMLDSTDFDERQKNWLEKSLKESTAQWKMTLFHHPLYSSGLKHGSQEKLKLTLEPLFLQYGVKVVFSGHDHFYERMNLQNGIQYFVTGGGGKLRKGGLDLKSSMRAASYDVDNHFMTVELDDTEASFKAISRKGQIVDEGMIKKSMAVPAAATAGAF